MASTGFSSLAIDARTLDARGLKCPLPVLKMEKQLPNLPSGATLIVLATDPMAKIDIPLFCRQNGYACAIDIDAEGVMAFSIRKSN
ncbi:Sulfurtransferase TusA [Devosia equisanguinis]|uniref:Sulfurtransferase TusA n=1 Tax=Devosia equisanguinis TaxID=2490941 RepID=A0A3S4CE04_9HYPH|nr:Sulfurtransferase TusA [Devosia equisanguinis]